MKIIRRSYITLLELLIALTLAALLLTTISYFYSEVNLLNRRSETMQQEEFFRRYLQNRLSTVFLNTQPEYKNPKDFFFYTSDSPNQLFADGTASLTFVFNNGVSDRDESSDFQLAKLFVNKQHQLCLATWPLRSKWREQLPSEAQQEMLIDQVEKLSFSFYVSPERDRSKITSNLPQGNAPKAKSEENKEKQDQQRMPPMNQWVSQWRQDYKHLPAMLKVSVARKKKASGEVEEIIFAFPLPRSQQLIVYEQ